MGGLLLSEQKQRRSGLGVGLQGEEERGETVAFRMLNK